MARRNMCAILASLSLAAGCGGSPSSPSPSGTSQAAAESAVLAAMSQAMSRIALTARPIGDQSAFSPDGFSVPCASGGSMVITMSPPVMQQGTGYRSSSRVEYRDCRSQSITINGDPYLETSSEHVFSGGVIGDSTSTIRTTGGLRFEGAGATGRVRFDCTMNLTIRAVNGSPQISSTATGTITIEQPLGSAPVVRPCGPS